MSAERVEKLKQLLQETQEARAKALGEELATSTLTRPTEEEDGFLIRKEPTSTKSKDDVLEVAIEKANAGEVLNLNEAIAFLDMLEKKKKDAEEKLERLLEEDRTDEAQKVNSEIMRLSSEIEKLATPPSKRIQEMASTPNNESPAETNSSKQAEIMDGENAGSLIESMKIFQLESGDRVLAGTDKGYPEGHKRHNQNNEDRVVVCPRHNLVAVIDGMGGMNQGDLAAQILADSILKHPTDIDLAAENAIQEMKNRNINTGGAVLMAGQILTKKNGEKFLNPSQAGDAKLIIIRKNGEIIFKSEDQSPVQELVDLHRITADKALYHPNRNEVRNPVSPYEKDEIKVFEKIKKHAPIRLEAGDLVLFMSDGISDNFTAEEIAYAQQHGSLTGDQLFLWLSNETNKRMKNKNEIIATSNREKDGIYSDGFKSMPKPDNRALVIMKIKAEKKSSGEEHDKTKETEEIKAKVILKLDEDTQETTPETVSSFPESYIEKKISEILGRLDAIKQIYELSVQIREKEIFLIVKLQMCKVIKGVAVPFTTTNVTVDTVFDIKNNTIGIKNWSIEATKFQKDVELIFEKHIGKINEELIKFIEKEDTKNRQIEKIEIKNGQLEVTWKAQRSIIKSRLAEKEAVPILKIKNRTEFRPESEEDEPAKNRKAPNTEQGNILDQLEDIYRTAENSSTDRPIDHEEDGADYGDENREHGRPLLTLRPEVNYDVEVSRRDSYEPASPHRFIRDSSIEERLIEAKDSLKDLRRKREDREKGKSDDYWKIHDAKTRIKELKQELKEKEGTGIIGADWKYFWLSLKKANKENKKNEYGFKAKMKILRAYAKVPVALVWGTVATPWRILKRMTRIIKR